MPAPRKKSKKSKRKKVQLWKNYEDAVREIMRRYKKRFSIEDVDPKSGKVSGDSGYEWNIEITASSSPKTKGAMREKDVLVEVRRINRNLKPAEVGELVFRVEDTGAKKGYFVTPLGRGFSKGARKIAGHRNIGHIQVSDTASAEDYIIQYLEKEFVGAADNIGKVIAQTKDTSRFMVRDAEANLKQLTIDEINALSKKPSD